MPTLPPTLTEDDLAPLTSDELRELRSGTPNPSPQIVFLRARVGAQCARSRVESWARSAPPSSEAVALAARSLEAGEPPHKVARRFDLSTSEVREADLLADEMRRRRGYEQSLEDLAAAKTAAQAGSAAWAAWEAAWRAPPTTTGWDTMMYGPGFAGEPTPGELRRRALIASGIIDPTDRRCR
ncbi:hypothetical protein A2cp1_2134 [Anaeromyxobacter dehalogenans 2CP-1]|uniref:Uncharacterized protein n=1 Tax=Anaeromyxobacter dehalogenans (strain ATCC BAA-258 / DSM 21875 / 2CP-1) TaxID=455488 RepID=B8J968_ANAD2|nr:hypothetical protein [Anaeromyxobacter dehalogenans]ACL65474.1 hypothetical protein A2cp1_2134 [Anaeromyxobacter dehalogenans 2CP-1]